MNRKAKILFILQLPPPVHGSSVMGKYIKESKLINSSFRCVYVNSSLSKDMNDLGKMTFRKMRVFASVLFQTLSSLLLFKPDVCYLALTAKGSGFYKDLPLIFLFKLFRREIIFHLHNKGVSKYQDKWLDDKLYKFAFCNTKVILLSKRLYDDVRKYVNEKDVFICANGIVGQKIKKHEVQSVPVRLLYLSNMMKSKGVYDLLNACAVLKQKGLDFQCDFVGKWADVAEKQFRNKVKEKKIDDVVFAYGPKYGQEKDIFWGQADIFVFPTYNECFPLVVLEAMQFGLPVISTSEGGIPDIVEDGVTGYIIRKQNPEELAEKLEKLLFDEMLRKNMGNAAFQKFKNQYTLTHFEKKMCEILNTSLCKQVGR